MRDVSEAENANIVLIQDRLELTSFQNVRGGATSIQWA